jgi:tRNA threonylcarbamoyladenosine biosynthesis protein TsaB
MLGLLIDTSTEHGVAAVFDEDTLIWSAELPLGLQNSRTLMPALSKGFAESHIDPSKLTFVATGIGPGSYTGIRVGVCVAKTLAYAKKIPLIGICSLQGFIPHIDGVFVSLIDARIGGYYIQKGINIEGKIHYTSAPSLETGEQIESQLNDAAFVITPNLSVQSKITERYPDLPCQWIESSPNPQHLSEIAKELYNGNEYSLNGQLEILYLRKTQAEIEKETKKS